MKIPFNANWLDSIGYGAALDLLEIIYTMVDVKTTTNETKWSVVFSVDSYFTKLGVRKAIIKTIKEDLATTTKSIRPLKRYEMEAPFKTDSGSFAIKFTMLLNPKYRLVLVDVSRELARQLLKG